MISTKKLKKYAEQINSRIVKNIDCENDSLWLKDNRNRIIEIAQNIEIPNVKLPELFDEIRVFALAREIVEQTDGMFNENTLDVLYNFSLTFAEYDLLPCFIKLNLLVLLSKSLEETEFRQYTDNAVKSLVNFDKIDFSSKEENYLKQEQILLTNRDYAMSENSSKTAYRSEIAKISVRCGKSETEVAFLAADGLTENLFGKKKKSFYSLLGIDAKKENTNVKLFFYTFVPFLLATGTALAVSLVNNGATGILFGAVSLLPLYVCFVMLCNRIILHRIKPKIPLRLKSEYADEPDNKTAVTLTVVVPDIVAAEDFLTKTERYYASNKIENGVYLILADLCGAKEKETKQDEKIIQVLSSGIDELNNRYNNKFALIIRKRVLHGKEYFGRERKRGAIEDLVDYITGKNQDFKTVINGEEIKECKYVLTLDGDTVLPPQSVKKLIATAVHPANKDFGLVQPNIGVMPRKTTQFFKIMTDRWGIDSYNVPAKEVYSDLFGSGSFCGKGIFSVEKYAERISGKIAPMTVLSHDVLEGELIKTVNASDITLLDEFPDNAVSFYKRRERWIRGDWQLLPWIGKRLPALSKWKVFYNCVQSLFAPGVLLQITVSAFCRNFAVFLLAILELLLPCIFVYLDALLFDREKNTFFDKKEIRHNSIKRFLFSLLMLPYESYSSVISSCTALWRRLVSHKNTLKWNTFASLNSKREIKGYYIFFLPQTVLALISLVFFAVNRHFFTGAFLFTGWMFGPYVMYSVGQIEVKDEENLFFDEMFDLKLLKIRTQRFFYQSLKENNFVMPDNLQVEPYKGYAQRTSPTNIGFGILSVACGVKSGEYSPSLAVEMLEKQLEFIKNAPKYKGHLYNWYDTKNNIPISEFISTVDSGNLCACLISAKNGAEDILKQNVISKKRLKMLADSIIAFADETDDDFQVQLRTYANEFYGADEQNGVEILKRFLADKMVSEKVPYCREIAEQRLNDIEKSSFSEKILHEAEEIPQLKELLVKFPKSIKGILEYGDFKEKLGQTLWSQKNSAEIKKRVLDEFYKIYGFAYGIKEKTDGITDFIQTYLDEIDFSFLYDDSKKLLAIGYNSKEEKQSENYYDMLCSEARLTSFFCIASGKIPAENWFNMARPFSRFNNEPLCLSWSGTMFEYLMPNIFLPLREDSMLGISSKAAVEAQIKAGNKNGIWGISESAYNALDRSKEYKYKAFGVSKTAISSFKEEKVYSPYSTLLALEYAKRESMDNIVRLVENGMADKFGFYEAIDYTRTKGDRGGIVYSFMAHHSGMSLCALTNFLYCDYIKKLFTKENYISASLVLLEEKVPIGVKPRKELFESQEKAAIEEKQFVREYLAPDRQNREAIILKGDNVSARVDSKGDIQVFFGKKYAGKVSAYFVDEKKTTASFEPIKDTSMNYKAVFVPGNAKFVSEDKQRKFELSVFAADNAVLFDMQAENKSKQKRKVKFVFLVETVLEYKDVFESHPAFNGLFIKCDKIANGVKTENRRSLTSGYVYSLKNTDKIGTDRFYAIGRGRDASVPLLEETFKKYPISPCTVLSAETVLELGESENISFAVGRDEAIRNRASFDLHFSKAKNNGMALASSFGITREMWKMSLVILAQTETRCVNKTENPDILWRYGISDRRKLLALKISKNRKNVETLLKICNYLFYLGADYDLVLIEDAPDDYLNNEFNLTERMIENMNNRDNIFHIRMSNREDIEKIRPFCFLMIDSDNDLYEEIKPKQTVFVSEKNVPKDNPYAPSLNTVPSGKYDNGYGLFTDNGEYYIYSRTPEPWTNVVSLGNMGFIATESGGGYTFYKNSALNKLSRWSNDPVSDLPGEALYVKDNQLQRFWSITRDPVDLGDEHDTLFGQGYVTYGYNGFGIKQQQSEFVHSSLPIKIITVEMDNLKTRDISLYYYLCPQMCENGDYSQKQLEIVEIDGIPCVKNNSEYMFIYADNCKFNVSESSFLGDGGMRQPSGVKYGFSEIKENQQGRICLSVEIKAKTQNDIFICVAENEEQVKEYVQAIKQMDTLAEKQKTNEKFKDVTGKIKISTPDEKLNVIFNNWLMYQVISSRMNGRCGYYQAGGAYGFRDQLQDCIALMKIQPNAVREHILRCAEHQFASGDVQHWWHEKYRGVRTNISDDLLFMPLICAKYIGVTGDRAILEEKIPFLEGHTLNGKADIYEEAWQSKESATLYVHCIRAIRLAISRSGKHSLPLILGGDWNDGMNKIGDKGKGESVWLGWFLYDVISEFLPYCEISDKEFFINHAKKLYDALNTVCWDGKWYLRAIDDHGNLIGSSSGNECQIDSISQSWAVLSGAGKQEMCKSALESAYEKLVDRNSKTVKLLTPPINGRMGYIGDYLPGIRENGGQYTHGAVWLASAFSQMGESEKCFEILQMLNPINHSFDRNSAEKYMIEPYVMAGDIYSNEECAGRGGWSWYTGSASLYYDAILTELLGIKIENGNITVEPHIPPNWSEYKVYLENEQTEVKVMNPNRKTSGTTTVTNSVKDGKREIRVVM